MVIQVFNKSNANLLFLQRYINKLRRILRNFLLNLRNFGKVILKQLIFVIFSIFFRDTDQKFKQYTMRINIF